MIDAILENVVEGLLLERTWVYVLAPIGCLTTVYNSRPRGSDVPFWLLWAPDMYVILRHACRQNSHMNKIVLALAAHIIY